MVDLWLIDFITGEKIRVASELSYKKARKLARKKNKRDRFSLVIIVPFGFSLCE